MTRHSCFFFPRAVFFASSLMQRASAARMKVTILYATETGKSETLAHHLGDLFSCAFSPKVTGLVLVLSPRERKERKIQGIQAV